MPPILHTGAGVNGELKQGCTFCMSFRLKTTLSQTRSLSTLFHGITEPPQLARTMEMKEARKTCIREGVFQMTLLFASIRKKPFSSYAFARSQQTKQSSYLTPQAISRLTKRTIISSATSRQDQPAAQRQTQSPDHMGRPTPAFPRSR